MPDHIEHHKRKRQRSLWEGCGLLFFGILLVEILLSVTTVKRSDDRTIDNATIEDMFDALIQEPKPYLMLGDSVLAGDVLAQKENDPHAPRVLDALRHHLGNHDPATFRQIALDGMILPDVLAVVKRLDKADPEGKVTVVVELNVRHFSPAYADTLRPAHPWLAIDESPWDVLRAYTPVLRHRSAITLNDEWVDTLAPTPTPRTDPVQVQARLAAHYREPVLSQDSAAVRSLQAVMKRLRQSKRPAVFFLTPLEDGFAASTLKDEGLARLSGRLSHLIDGDGKGRQRFVSLDHPLFGPDAFVDHCHLSHRGTDLLARNLLSILNLRVRTPLVPSQRAYEEGDDATLLTQILPGHFDGPPWLARLDSPDGIAVSDDARRIIIADTGNHLLRELVGDLRTLRTLAGVPGQKRPRTGSSQNTPILHPRHPVIFDDDVYFLAGARSDELWRVTDHVVEKMTDVRGRPVRHLRALKGSAGRLLALDVHDDVWDITPGRPKRLLVDVQGAPITAVAASQAGEIFFAVDRGGVWQAVTPLHDQPAIRFSLSDAPVVDSRVKQIFRNTGGAPTANPDKVFLPNARNSTFPFRAEDVHLPYIRDLHFVERYGALLIVGEEKTSSSLQLEELIHLQLLDLKKGLIFPWVRPRISGAAHVAFNARAAALTTPFRRGAYTLHQPTAALFTVEKERGRLVVINDGMWGLARIGHTPSGRKFSTGRHELFGSRAGAAAHARFQPEGHLNQRFSRTARQGPFTVLLVTSSLSTLSDRVGMLPLGRQLERRWRQHHAPIDHLRLHVIQRAFGGPSLEEFVSAIEQHTAGGGRPDVVVLELGDALGQLWEKPRQATQRAEILDRLVDTAQTAGTLLLGLDVSPLDQRHREGPVKSRRTVVALAQLLAARGIDVISDDVGLVRESLDVAPFGSVPYASSHASPWAIAVAGEYFADRLYPFIRRHLQGRKPRWTMPEEKVMSRVLLRDTLPKVSTSSLESRAMAWSVAAGVLEIFVDLNHISAETSVGAPLARAAVRRVALSDPAALLATELHIRMARFATYDEYGEGATRGAEVLWEERMDAEAAGRWMREERP